MNRDPDSWQRLGALMRAERQRQGLTREQLAALAKVSPKSVQTAELGRVPQGRRPYTLDAIERALGWGAGSIDSVLEGGELLHNTSYDPFGAVPDEAATLSTSDLPRFVVELIRFTHLGVKAGASKEAAKDLEDAAVAFVRSFPEKW